MVKKILSCLSAVCMIFSVIPSCYASSEKPWRELYVSVYGDDGGNGTKEQPFGTIKRAKEEVAILAPDMKGDIVVNIQSGTYYQEETLSFTTADSGQNGYKVIYRGEDITAKPIISGGKTVSGFKPYEKNPSIYVTDVDGVEAVRELYVNGKRRYMAGSEVKIKAQKRPDETLTDEYKMKYPDAPTDSYTYYDPETKWKYDGIYLSKKDFGNVTNVEDIEFVWHIGWKTSIAKVSAVKNDPYRRENVIVLMDNSWWSYTNETDRQANGPSGRSPFFISNCFEMLDSPGEFYYNKHEGKLYYMPSEDENPETMEVVVPVIEKLVTIDGNDIDDKVCNVSFENLQFSHSTWLTPLQGSLVCNQASAFIMSNDLRVMDGAFCLNYTNNICIKDSIFSGIGSAAIDINNANEHTYIIGNAFYDIGDTSMIVGRLAHADKYIGRDGQSETPPDDPNLQANVIELETKICASYYGDGDTTIRWLADSNNTPRAWSLQQVNTKSWAYDEDLTCTGAWKSDIPSDGSHPWVRYTFDRPYSLDRIVLAFDETIVKPEERSDFEILLSNDKNFAEGSYITAAVQNGTANCIAEYTVENDEKYRYMMIRGLKNARLALSRAWAFTPDRAPFVKYQRNKHTIIENNYIKRVAVNTFSGGGIHTYFTENMRINHNEITDLAYSGIMNGWGWKDSVYGSYDNEINYNYVHDTNYVVHDGGCIYTLSRNYNVYEGNYCEKSNIGVRALYLDEGSSSEVWTNNVLENCTQYFGASRANNVDNVVKNNYSSMPFSDEYVTLRQKNEIGEVSLFTTGNPSKNAYAIIKEAGLEPQYAYVKDFVTDIDNPYPEPILNFISGSADENELYNEISHEAESLLNSPDWGKSFGQYDVEIKDKLREIYGYYSDKTSSRALMAEAKEMIYKAKKTFKRKSLEETVEAAESILSEAEIALPGRDNKKNIGKYAHGSAEALKEAIVKAEDYLNKNSLNYGEEYDILTSLEKAVCKFENSVIGGKVDYLYADGIISETVDCKKREIHIVVADGKPDKTDKFQLYLSDNAQLASNTEYISLKNGTKIPVFDKENRVYTFWTIVSEYESVADAGFSEKSVWVTQALKNNSIDIDTEGNLYLKASPYPYLSRKSAENGIKFVPMSASGSKEFVILAGISSPQNYNVYAQDGRNDRLEILFDGSNAELFSVKGEKRTSLAKEKCKVNYNSENSFSLKNSKIGERDYIYAELNGKPLFSVFCDNSPKGEYLGFMLEGLNLKINKGE